MGTARELRLSSDSTLELHPLQVRREGDAYIVGRFGAGSYLVMQEPALDTLALLRQGIPLGRVKRELALRHGEPDVAIRSFLETLFAARFVKAVDGLSLDEADTPAATRAVLLSRRRVAWLFAPGMLAVYATVLLLGVLALVVEPAHVPRLRDLRVSDRYAVVAGLMLVLTLLMAAKHELAHLVAARFVGVDATIGIGHRFFFPVLQTNLTELWSVARAKRFIAYAAGILSDLLVVALALVALELSTLGVWALASGIQQVLKALVALGALMVLWQLNVFFRTDVYYMVSDALGCRDLYADGWRQVRVWARRLGGRPAGPRPLASSRHERAIIAIYAALVLLGHAVYVLAGLVYLAHLAVFLLTGSSTVLSAGAPARDDPVDRLTAALLLLLTAGLLTWSLVHRRRHARAAVDYRLRSDPGL